MNKNMLGIFRYEARVEQDLLQKIKSAVCVMMRLDLPCFAQLRLLFAYFKYLSKLLLQFWKCVVYFGLFLYMRMKCARQMRCVWVEVCVNASVSLKGSKMSVKA